MRIVVSLALLAATALPAPALAQTETKSEPKPHRSTWFASAEVLYLETEPDTGGRINLSFDDSRTAGVDASFLGGSGVDDFAYAPRATVGWRWNHPCGGSAGIQARFFDLQDSLAGFPTLEPGTTMQPNFATHTETSSVDLYSADFEALVAYSRWGVTVEGTWGRRWAHFAAEASIESFGVFTSGNFVQLQLSNGSSFEGDGDVWGLSAAYRIPKTPLSVFVGKRDADLDGDSGSFGRAVGTVASSPSAPLVGAATVRRNNPDTSKLKIEETRYGLQADFGDPTDRVRSYVRVAYERMEWNVDGPPTGGAGFGGTIGFLTTNSFSRAGLGGITLKGWSLAIGLLF